MAETEILEHVEAIIDSVEADAKAKIDVAGSYYIEPHTRRNVYIHALDAVRACRSAIKEVPTTQDEMLYLGEVCRKLERARQVYVETSGDDEDGYGSATFHMIIRQIRELFDSLSAIVEYVDANEPSIMNLGSIDD